MEKVEASYLHHDHTSGRTVQGHQLLELGIVGDGSFVPVDRQIYTGSKNVIQKPEGKDFKDKRSASSQDMKRAIEEDKNQMLARMLKSAIKAGFKARHLLGDAWFGIKKNIDTAIDLGSGLGCHLSNEAQQTKLSLRATRGKTTQPSSCMLNSSAK